MRTGISRLVGPCLGPGTVAKPVGKHQLTEPLMVCRILVRSICSVHDIVGRKIVTGQLQAGYVTI
ncbi:hypothetical protein D3C75_668630 [compost metagenome]